MGYTKWCFFNLPIQCSIKTGLFTDVLMGSMSPSRVIIYWEYSGGGIIADATKRPQNLTFAQDDIIYHFFPTKFASWLVSQQFAATTLRRHLGARGKEGSYRVRKHRLRANVRICARKGEDCGIKPTIPDI